MRLSGICAIALAGVAYAKPIKQIKRQSIEDTYDFIIAGGTFSVPWQPASTNCDTGGTAGLVIANRLTECPNIRVLVLEAGPEPGIVANYMYPGGNQYLAGHVYTFRSAEPY